MCQRCGAFQESDGVLFPFGEDEAEKDEGNHPANQKES